MLFYGWTLHIFYLICNFCTKQPSCSPGADGPSIHILGVRPHKMCQMLRIIPKHKCPSNKETDLLFRAYITWRWGTNVFTTFQSRNCKVLHALPKEGGGGGVWRHARPEKFFSWSIPPKFENKLHCHKQRFGKIVRGWGFTPGNSWWGVPPSSPNPALFQTKICHPLGWHIPVWFIQGSTLPPPPWKGHPVAFTPCCIVFGDEMWHFISGADYLYRVLSVGNRCLHLTPWAIPRHLKCSDVLTKFPSKNFKFVCHHIFLWKLCSFNITFLYFRTHQKESRCCKF